MQAQQDRNQNHNDQNSCISFSEFVQRQIDLDSFDDILFSQLSSNGQPILVVCKRKVRSENLFTLCQYRQIIINVLHSYMEPNGQALIDTLQKFTDKQLCEIVESMGKYFWDIAARSEPNENIQNLKNYYRIVFHKQHNLQKQQRK
ncbi:Hypothetical_protein [Hexamita inflata]|uniref:Hypothetical_protein n=1 Tax=Hexamita inflata TaxID=28002 RepID=A0AA86RNJ5_9EUKA|nr:Hypothetical protein HINF_LOCUS65471 [Hexamita inflata]